jgi:DMSO reductase anchor subunit
MLAPLAALVATDYFLTVYSYHYAFRWQAYVTTWAWYLMAMVLGQILLHAKTTFVRVTAGALLGPTSFFLVSNYAVWASGWMYPHSLGGLGACFAAAVPFYRNDLLSTAIVAGAAFGVPVLVRRLSASPAQSALAEK